MILKSKTLKMTRILVLMMNKEVNLRPLSYMKAHLMLGHAEPKLTISTEKKLGFKVKSINGKCIDCGQAKSTRKNICGCITFLAM